MEGIYKGCCGLDIHKRRVVACLGTLGPEGQLKKEVRSFGTMTEELLALADGLQAAGCTHVAMESPGVYWQPIYNRLEGHFELLLVHAQPIQAVPGRKSEVKDCQWIAELLPYGLLPGSLVPERKERELPERTRYRPSLVRARTAAVNRRQKTLAGAKIKLASVRSEVTGVSGGAMLEALVAGSTDAAALADLAKGRLREKLPELARALRGRFGPHQGFLVAQPLAHIDFLDGAIEPVSQEVAQRLGPFESTLEGLDSLPGVGRWTAEVILAEIGTEMDRFADAGHLASWAGLCPGKPESAGKRQSGRSRKGLRVALTEAAYAAGRGKGTYLSAQYHRLVARRGKKKGAVAVGHSILVIAYHILKDQTTYQELGADYFDQRDHETLRRQLVHRLAGLGYSVSLTPLAEAA